MQEKKSIKLGSWNLQNFAATTKKNIEIVVEAILKFDLIALQEIRDKKGVEILVAKTGYNYWLSDPVGSSETTAHQTGKRKERYAFLWNNRIKCLQTPQLINGNKYFVRSPAIGFFASSFSQSEKENSSCRQHTLEKEENGFDFIFSTVHIVWGQKRDREAELKSIKKFLKEMRKVCLLDSFSLSHCDEEREKGKDTQKSFAQAKQPSFLLRKKEGNIILCGDFNTDLNNERELDWFNCIRGGTVIKSGNCYDNFWVSKETVEFLEAGVEKVAWSDHFPIYANFSCDIDNDDLEKIELNNFCNW